MPRSVKGPFAAALGCAVALAVLAALVYGIDGVQRVDSDFLGSVMTRTGDEAGPVVNAVARLADPIFLILALVAACGVALWRRRPVDALAAAIAVAGANLTTQLLKHAFTEHRIQPHLVNGEILPADIFPSGHATAAASMAIAFALVAPRSRLPLVAAAGCLFVLAVDVCVLILAWHFLSDVIAGTLVAGCWGFSALGARRLLESSRRGALAQPPVRSAIDTK